ncbi:MAG: class I SAM-dependent methyltransferase [Lentisphaeria bacterium]
MNSVLKQMILHKGREKSLLRRHPWIFSGAIKEVMGEPNPGETVEVLACDGSWLARAAFSPASQIRARVWTFAQDEGVDADFFVHRLQQSLEYREKIGVAQQSNAYRLVHGEADGLPACVVDRYNDFLCCQFLSAGAEFWKKEMIAALAGIAGLRGIYERSDNDSRTRDGLPLSTGTLWGEDPPEKLLIQENGLHLQVHLQQGHKTGYYLDQRDSKMALTKDLCKEAKVLDCCCYSGGFGIRALKAGADSVCFVDAADKSLQWTADNAALNEVPAEKMELLKGDVFQLLRTFRDSRRSFDVIILDPPKFADTQIRLEKAARGYKDINLLAAKLLRPGGMLFTFSCSAAMTPEFFRKVIGDAARDAGRDALLVRSFAQAPDHPQALNFPEGHYLTGLQLQLR